MTERATIQAPNQKFELEGKSLGSSLELGFRLRKERVCESFSSLELKWRKKKR